MTHPESQDVSMLIPTWLRDVPTINVSSPDAIDRLKRKEAVTVQPTALVPTAAASSVTPANDLFAATEKQGKKAKEGGAKDPTGRISPPPYSTEPPTMPRR